MATTIAPTRSAGPARFRGPVRCLIAALTAASAAPAIATDLYGDFKADIAVVQAVGEKGQGNVAAAAALERLVAARNVSLPILLQGFADAGPIGRNLLSGVGQALAERVDETDLIEQLTGTLRVRGLHPQAAALAYRLLNDADPDAAAAYLKSDGLDSPAPAVRRAAVAAKLDALGDRATPADLAALLNRALDRDQVEELAERLKAAGETVDLPRQFGFLTNWQIVGPFDHRGDTAFDRTIPPEENPGALDRDATFPTTYPGAGEVVTWQPLIAGGDYGKLDIAGDLTNWKGSAVMLARTFDAPAAGPVTFRIGTPNAFKLYLNGDLVFARPEYHRGTRMDQYLIPATLRAGQNLIAVKLLQNEQEDSWAQAYQWQFRVTDASGAAVREPGSFPSKPAE